MKRVTEEQRRYLLNEASSYREMAKRGQEAIKRNLETAATYKRLAAKRNLTAAEIDWIMDGVGLVNHAKMGRLGFIHFDPEANRKALLEIDMGMRKAINEEIDRHTRDANKEHDNVVALRGRS